MPIQTQGRNKIKFPDGCKLSVKPNGEGSYTDLGVISTAVNGVINFDESQFETANFGKLQKRVRNMTFAIDCTLLDIDPVTMEKLSGGMMTKTVIAGTNVTTIADQVIPVDSAELSPINLVVVDNSGGASDGTKYKISGNLVVASVNGSTDGALVANDDYSIVDDSNSQSAKSIIFNTAGSALTTMNQTFTIAYTSLDPVARTDISMGTSSFILDGFAMKATYTDGAGLTREWEVTNANLNSGGIAFNFGGANEDDPNGLPLSITADLDTALVDGSQLITYREEEGVAG